MTFPRQEYWSEVPFPPLGDLPNPGIKPQSLAPLALLGGFLTTVPRGNPQLHIILLLLSTYYKTNTLLNSMNKQ